MGCLWAILGVFLPRLALFIPWVMGTFQASVWGVIGWFLMPYTTLAATIACTNGIDQPWNIVLIVIGVLFDMGFGGANASAMQGK